METIYKIYNVKRRMAVAKVSIIPKPTKSNNYVIIYTLLSR